MTCGTNLSSNFYFVEIYSGEILFCIFNYKESNSEIGLQNESAVQEIN
jgi:hypothetical protein